MPLSADELIEQLAASQLGLVTRAQLRARGITQRAIATRVQAKRLRRLHRGVYRVGPLTAPHVRELAAVLACGPHAVLSHRSAGALWQLLPDPGDAAPVDISLSQGDRGRSRKIRVHRVCLPAEDVTVLENIPVTSVIRTLVDLAAVLASRDVERVLAQTERLNLLERGDLLSLAARHAGRPGAPLLRKLLETETGPALTRSEAEERFLALIRKSQLAPPESNVRVGDYEVDFLWRRERLVVEVDGFAFHSSQRKFESDRRRDAWLTAHGVTVLRVTWRQVAREPEAVLVRLAQTLTRIGLDRLRETR
jgi:very-short-patch-repair endonuclease